MAVQMANAPVAKILPCQYSEQRDDWKERWKRGSARMNSEGEKSEFQLAIWKT